MGEVKEFSAAIAPNESFIENLKMKITTKIKAGNVKVVINNGEMTNDEDHKWLAVK